MGATARVSGWGLTDGDSDSLSDVLRYIDVKVISNADCAAIYGDIPNGILCTSGEQGTGSCNGDSGGPLVNNNQQIGVVSFGVVGCAPGYPNGFTRVTAYNDWIQRNIG